MIGTTLVVGLAGGAGAALRLVVNATVHRRVRTNYPVAMFAINTTGSFLLGVIAGYSAHHLLPGQWGLYLGVGLVGGFTAFSTTSFQTLRLVQERRFGLAVLNSFGMVTVAVVAAGLGVWLGRVL